MGYEVTKSFKNKTQLEGVFIEWDSAEDLAEAMFYNLRKVSNPFDPSNTEYEIFNDKIEELKELTIMTGALDNEE